MNTELETTYASDIRQLAVELAHIGSGIQGNIVTYANTAREIGLRLQSWCGHEQINFKFFEARSKDIPFDFDRARRFVRIAVAMPKPAKTIEDVRQVEQMVLVAGGFLELPEHASAQKPSQITPTVRFLKQVGTAKEEFAKLAESEPPEKWPAERREYVRGQLQWAVDLYAKLG